MGGKVGLGEDAHLAACRPEDQLGQLLGGAASNPDAIDLLSGVLVNAGALLELGWRAGPQL